MDIAFPPRSHDPYDPWMTPLGVKARERFYRGEPGGRVLSLAIAGVDWLLPATLRHLIGSPRRIFPITLAQRILSIEPRDLPDSALQHLVAVSCRGANDGLGWGLGFPWMSKNGLYDARTPFVTHTPYAMEALLHLARDPRFAGPAMNCFADTWGFLDSLLVMHEGAGTLAVSYAPVAEPRIVVNANAYAAFAYALHHAQGHRAELAAERALALVRWVVGQQRRDGSWLYYADSDPGNFIDGFHTCFVLKNLRKAGDLLPEAAAASRDAIALGRRYLDETLFDARRGLLRRFAVRDLKDPYVWDLYDQAEYLGVLVQAGELPRAAALRAKAESVFRRGERWY
jgi:hypothetical protein